MLQTRSTPTGHKPCDPGLFTLTPARPSPTRFTRTPPATTPMALACITLLLTACASVPTPTPSKGQPGSVGSASGAPPFTDKPIPAAPGPAASAPSRPGAATAGAAPGAAASAPRGQTASAPPAPGQPPAPRPFADVVKEAKSQDGFVPLWSREDKLWLELKPEHFGKTFFLQGSLSRGVMSGLATSVASPMLQGQLVQLRKVGGNVQLVALNATNTAKPGTPLAAAVAEGTSESLLAVAPVQSQPHPERQSVLVEAGTLFLGDLPMYTHRLDLAHRAGYALDRANSYIRSSQTQADTLTLDVAAHFAVPRLPVPNPVPTPVPQPTPVGDLADARSFFVGFYYTLSKLPEVPMRARLADGRVGHFNQRIWDFGDDSRPFPRQYVVKRWRLEKADPAAALSEPKRPITYWLDKNIPLAYRATVRAGVLEWNKAFERIGFQNAIRVEQQPDDATWSTQDARHASVRWYVDHSDGALAVGPSLMDPRTGEILDADITLGNGWVTLARRYAQVQAPKPTPGAALGAGAGGPPLATNADGVATFLPALSGAPLGLSHASGGHAHAAAAEAALCSQQSAALNEASFGLDLLALRAHAAGKPMTPEETERIVHAILKDVVTHEVGHTLGLRHNFRASTVYTQAQLNQAAFTRSHGMGGSVMDYNAFNFALDNEPQGEVAMSTLGPYDHWAIEYAYKEIPAEREAVELESIARRGSTDPLLAYGTDEELGGGGDGMDPEVNQRDLGADPLLFAQRRVRLTQELWARLQARPLPLDADYDVLTRNFASGLSQLGGAMQLASKYVGGVVYVRDQAGSPRSPMTPVSAARQRQALKLINEHLLALDGFNLRPEFTSRLVDSALDRGYAPPQDRSLDASLTGLQTGMLDRLFSAPVAERIQNARHKLANPSDAFTLAELYQGVHQAVWRAGPGSGNLSPVRRALQREYTRRLAAAITRPGGGSAVGDARALHRLHAKQLLAQAQQALARGDLPLQTRAHLSEVADTLRAALQAQAVRVVS